MKKGGREEVFELGLEHTALLKSIPENRFDPKHLWRFDVAGCLTSAFMGQIEGF